MSGRRRIKTLVVDDSAVVRRAMGDILSLEDDIEVIGTARDPYVAAEYMARETPDVIILDIEMPRMDGITFLKKIMSQHPLPVVICSTLTEKGAETTLRAMEYGAVEIIQKPRLGAGRFIEESRITICDAVRAASRVVVQKTASTSMRVGKKLSADAILPPPTGQAMVRTTEKVVAIGASTGGTEALATMLAALPRDCYGMVVVQHMPEGFTRAFAERLNTLCVVTVKEAGNGDTVIRGQVLIAPGNCHALIKRSGARYYVEIKDGPLVCRHRPSVDVLFRSCARYAGKNGIGVIMTGMGDDGARGMLEMKEAGAATIAQDEKSCVVFGMPNEAIKAGAVDRVVSLDRIAREIMLDL